MKYRKKPVVIDAFRLGYDDHPSWFTDAVGDTVVLHQIEPHFASAAASIRTLEGTMRAERGDWIIKGVNGEIYPCKPDIFDKTYERA
jgi:hypothetical protein